MPCTSDLATLANDINKCEPYAGILAKLSELCVAIEALEGSSNNIQHNSNDYSIPAVNDNTGAYIEFAPTVAISNIPAGSNVGNTTVISFDGTHRINYSLTVFPNGFADTVTFRVLVNGTETHVATIVTDVALITAFAFETTTILTAGDVITYEALGGVNGGNQINASIISEKVS